MAQALHNVKGTLGKVVVGGDARGDEIEKTYE